MTAHRCIHHDHDPKAIARDKSYRRVLWIALAINAAMFRVEISAGLACQSNANRAFV